MRVVWSHVAVLVALLAAVVGDVVAVVEVTHGGYDAAAVTVAAWVLPALIVTGVAAILDNWGGL